MATVLDIGKAICLAGWKEARGNVWGISRRFHRSQGRSKVESSSRNSSPPR